MPSLNKTRGLFYIKVHEVKKALIEDIGPFVHLKIAYPTVSYSLYNCIYLLWLR